jgi:hypothetical protein
MIDPSLRVIPLITAIRLEGSSLHTIPDILNDDGVVADRTGAGSGSLTVLAGAPFPSSEIGLRLVFFSPVDTEGGLFSASLSIFGAARIVSPRLPRTGSRDWTVVGGLTPAGGDDVDSPGPCPGGACEASFVVEGGLTTAGSDDSGKEPISGGADEAFRLDVDEPIGAGADNFHRNPNCPIATYVMAAVAMQTATKYNAILLPGRGKSALRISAAILGGLLPRDNLSRSSFFKASSMTLISGLS